MQTEKDYHSIGLIPGDLNGITVTDAAVELVKASSGKLEKPIRHTTFPYNADYFLKHQIKELRNEDLAALQKNDQIFLGAVGDPTKVKPGDLEIGILLKTRQEFDQYVNLRPVVQPKGTPSTIAGKKPEDIDFEICRENSEGLYVNIGWIEKQGTEDEAGYQIMKCTYKGIKRLAEFAEQRARKRMKGEKPTLHFVFKTNVLIYAGHPWTRVVDEYAAKKGINAKYMHIDNFVMQMVDRPEQFDVVLTENMFGDIATDLGAALQGGIGSAVSGNINPTGKYPSMFEPIHGTAPDKWYEMDDNGNYIPGTKVPEKVQLIRPEAAFLSYAMMLEQLGETRAADAIKAAALANIRDPAYKTKKLDELVRQACDFVRE